MGRALNGHPDVGDVVQEAMLRAPGPLGSLHDPAGFRSWLVGITMNRLRIIRAAGGTFATMNHDRRGNAA